MRPDGTIREGLSPALPRVLLVIQGVTTCTGAQLCKKLHCFTTEAETENGAKIN